MVSAVSSSTSNVNAASTADSTKLNQDFDQFLTLLTTQLQNQDPLSPMDSSEFTNQLVQFSSVEQQIKSNTLLENLLSTQTLNMTALGVSFIGKDVEVEAKDFKFTSGKSSPLAYSLPSEATTGTVTIVDENGETVYSKAIDTASGRHEFTWDGKDNNGQPVASGTYTLKVAALTEDNTSLNVTTFVPGHVSALESDDTTGGLVLVVDGQKIPLTNVRKISETSS